MTWTQPLAYYPTRIMRFLLALDAEGDWTRTIDTKTGSNVDTQLRSVCRTYGWVETRHESEMTWYRLTFKGRWLVFIKNTSPHLINQTIINQYSPKIQTKVLKRFSDNDI